MISKSNEYVKNSIPEYSKPLVRWGNLKKQSEPTRTKISNWIHNYFDRKTVRVYCLVLLISATGLIPLFLDTISEILILLSGLHLDLFWNYLVIVFSEVVKFFANNSAFIYVPMVGLLIYHLRRNHAYRKLENQEKKNEKIVEESGNMLALIGPSGTGKTTIAAYLALISERYIRNLTLKIMRRQLTLFPDFDFRKIERMVESKVKDGTFKNRSHIHNFIGEQKKKFENGEITFLGDYSGKVNYYDGLSIKNMWSVIYKYAAAYFIYSITSPLSSGNLAIAHDLGLPDEFYFPIYDSNPIRRTEEDWKKRKFNK